MARWQAVFATLFPVVQLLAGTQVCAAERPGNSAAITIGYLSALGDHNTILIEDVPSTFASDNIFVGATAEGPMLWRAVYPFAAAKWLLNNRYNTDQFTAHIDTRGFLACAGLGYGLDAWRATWRLEAAVGYWWEDIEVDYELYYGLAPFVVENDEVAMVLVSSFAFPFTSRIDALISSEFVVRAEREFDGEFQNGRDYQVVTNGTYGTVSIGLTVGLGAR